MSRYGRTIAKREFDDDFLGPDDLEPAPRPVTPPTIRAKPLAQLAPMSPVPPPQSPYHTSPAQQFR